MATWREIHLAAALEAGRAHRDLGIDTETRIDPFAALSASGVVAVRRPLDQAAGLYVPAGRSEGMTAGALINVLHPISKQRYTAAHELAHHRRDRQAVLDLDTEWLGRDDRDDSDRERFAEAFASWFLLPRSLVHATIERLGFSRVALRPASVYQIALELGTSYRATANHLRGLRLVDRGQLQQLLAATPRAIKEALGGRDAAEDLRRDVWHFGAGETPRLLQPIQGDILVVDASETPTAGFLWAPDVSVGLTFVNDDYGTEPDDDLVGGRIVHRFRFRVDSPGEESVQLSLKRPWEAAEVEELTIPVAAEHRPVSGIVDPHLLLEAQA